MVTKKIDPTIGDSGPWAEGIRRANAILDMAVGDSRHPVSAQWSLAQDEEKRPLLSLELSDRWGSIRAKFAPDELEDSEQLWFRMHRLWSNLLTAGAEKLLQALDESGSGAA